MTTRKIFTILLVANLLTVALVTAAFQAGGLLAAGPDPQPDGTQATGFDGSLVPLVPWTMNYQGILKDSGGTPLTGSHDLVFNIYRYDGTIPADVKVWTETHNAVAFTNGLFNVTLGTTVPLHGDVFTGVGKNGVLDGDTILGVRVDGGAELSPLTTLRSVPYAHRADYVNRFPAPHYDSGWTNVVAASNTFTHTLGGDTDNYVVDMQFKDTGASGMGIHQASYGMDQQDGGADWGAFWYSLDTSKIKVYVGINETLIDQVRVRIWRID